MKKFIIVLLSGILTLSVTAQTITITFNGANRNRNYHVVLDGTSYYSNASTDPNSTTTNVRKEVTLTNQQLGSHTIEVYRQRTNSSNNSNGTNTTPFGNAVYTNTFQLRSGYDMNIAINGNGQVAFTEKRIRNQGRRGQNVTPMADATFNQLLQSVRSRFSQSSKITLERDAFINTANYFTTEQVRQLLSLISTESNRLALAKLAYPRVTDPANFTLIYNMFNTASRNNLEVFVLNNPNNNNSGNWGNNNNNNNSNKTPMADYQFSQLLQTINSQYSQSSKYSTISGSFNNSAIYFTTAQVRQLLNIITSETDRLTLAKQSYLRVSDPANFSTLYDLFYTQSYKNDLNNYVIQNGGSGNVQNNTRTTMSDYQFSQLLQTINSQYNQANKYSTITGAFSNSSNYFSTVQIRQLLSTISSEVDRLALAKQSYLKVTDPANFSSLYDLFYTQAYRNDLNNYVIQNGGTSTYTNTQYNTRIAMDDATFTQVLQKVSNHILPWSKVRDANAAFTNTSYYFSTSQIRQILTVISSENDRLELAKLSWSRVSDPTNFNQLYDLFSSQSNRDALNAYIVARPF